MQGFTAHNPVTLSFTTDTQTPQTIIPVFLIHMLEQPFCSQPSCGCHQNQVTATALLAAINQGAMALREAVDFTEGKQG